MGQEQSLRNLDKRTARREYKDDFSRAIEVLRHAAEINQQHPCLAHDIPDGTEEESFRNNGTIKVFVRKRPIFKAELRKSEFDVVTCLTPRTIVVHDARMDKNMKTQLLKHHEYRFHQVFDEHASNYDIFEDVVFPILTKVKQCSQNGTIFMYSQTGSGKTYTMSALYQFVADELFSSMGARETGVGVSLLEISGENCFDLLNNFNPVTILKCNHKPITSSKRNPSIELDEEYFEPFPVVQPWVYSADDFFSLVSFGFHCRSTAATGSEHKVDSMYHSKVRQRESAEINSSLMALKNCLHARIKSNNASLFRKTALTRMLKETLTSTESSASVIVTISPASKDTEHSLNSLRHACLMDGQDTTNAGQESRFITGGITTVVQVGEVNLTARAKSRKELGRQGIQNDLKTCNGNRFNKTQAQSTFGEGHETKTQHDQFSRMNRDGIKCLERLSPLAKMRLRECRNNLGSDPKQLQRLRAVPAQILRKALTKAGISSDKSQHIVDQNICHINSVFPMKSAKIRKQSSHYNQEKRRTNKKEKVFSIVAALLHQEESSWCTMLADNPVDRVSFTDDSITPRSTKAAHVTKRPKFPPKSTKKIRENRTFALRQTLSAEKANKIKQNSIPVASRWSHSPPPPNRKDTDGHFGCRDKYVEGKPWALAESSTNGTGMFFVVGGNMDSEDRSKNEKETVEVAYTPSFKNAQTTPIAPSPWSVEMARERYGYDSTYD